MLGAPTVGDEGAERRSIYDGVIVVKLPGLLCLLDVICGQGVIVAGSVVDSAAILVFEETLGWC